VDFGGKNGDCMVDLLGFNIFMVIYWDLMMIYWDLTMIYWDLVGFDDDLLGFDRI
jgi:hypothetical protein